MVTSVRWRNNEKEVSVGVSCSLLVLITLTYSDHLTLSIYGTLSNGQ